jgi:hypothetical protein
MASRGRVGEEAASVNMSFDVPLLAGSDFL